MGGGGTGRYSAFMIYMSLGVYKPCKLQASVFRVRRFFLMLSPGIILNHDYSSSVQVFILIHCYYIHSLQSPNVDQQHVVIEFSESENCFVLQDLNTAQGTYVNDCRVQNAAVRLAPGDILRFGYGGPAYELTVESPEQVGVISSVSVTMTIRIAIIFLHNIGGVFLASRVPGCHLGTQTLKNHSLGHQKDFVRNF